MMTPTRLTSARIAARHVHESPGRDSYDRAGRSLFDAGRHSEALTLLSAGALRMGRPETAFMFADRRCRLPAPTAHDFMLRATASRLMNETSYAETDLARAFEIDPTNDLVISNVLAWGPLALQPIAAASYLDGESDDQESLRLAMQVLATAATPIVSRMRVRDGMHAGWIAWRGEDALELLIRRSGAGKTFNLEPDASHPLACRAWAVAEISIEIESPRLESVSFRLGGKYAHTVFPAPDRIAALNRPTNQRSLMARHGVPDHLEVIVPVYGDYEATKACLDALEVEGSQIVKHVTVVDDCSPDVGIRAMTEDRAERGLFTLVRNEENFGFARSVNRILKRVAQCDLLLLNSDTVLPRRAIDRLALAAYSEARIATVTPLSNNGEFTSFPKPNACNTLPMRGEINALDAIANATNGRGIVDLPSGVGFCLYITRECFDALGPLSESYSRGYYEDVDYCLRAHEIGFRNVCATGVYVGHAGARSFQCEKRRLVVRNLKSLNHRFPDHERECAAFIKTDPLRSARAILEEHLAPEGTVVLLIAPSVLGRALALERARQIDEQGGDQHCIYCEVDNGNNCITIKSIRGSAPQSLTFSLADGPALARLQAYLTRLRPKAIEVIGPHALPDTALCVVFALKIPMRVACGDLDWMCGRDFVFERSCPDVDRPGECPACIGPARPIEPLFERGYTEDRRRIREVMAKAESVVPMDRMAAAFCAANLKSATTSHLAIQQNTRSDTAKLKPAWTVLGILCPELTRETDRQILAIERLFGEQGIQAFIIVLGRCSNELGIMARHRIFVTNEIGADEYERVIRQYRITHLFSPYRTRHFGLVDRLGAAFGLSKGYYDWSFGALDKEAADLALDPRICFERAAQEIGAWITDRSVGDANVDAAAQDLVKVSAVGAIETV
jgi:GT2 family glycosyltransferase